LAKEINDCYGSHTSGGEFATAAGGGGGGGEKSLDEIVYGFIKVANETMCRPIRALTEARGFEMGKHMCVFILFSPFHYSPHLLASSPLSSSALPPSQPSCLISLLSFVRLAAFGGAGGQHACDIAEILGIKTIVIHRYSSILSAYGLALADR
jgi:5-oxoprolinase (ATP-hydrolysing)